MFQHDGRSFVILCLAAVGTSSGWRARMLLVFYMSKNHNETRIIVCKMPSGIRCWRYPNTNVGLSPVAQSKFRWINIYSRIPGANRDVQ